MEAREVAPDSRPEHEQHDRHGSGDHQEYQNRQVIRQHATTGAQKGQVRPRPAPLFRGRIVAVQVAVLVPTVGFEPTRLAALAPQASVSTNSTTSATSD